MKTKVTAGFFETGLPESELEVNVSYEYIPGEAERLYPVEICHPATGPECYIHGVFVEDKEGFEVDLMEYLAESVIDGFRTAITEMLDGGEER